MKKQKIRFEVYTLIGQERIKLEEKCKKIVNALKRKGFNPEIIDVGSLEGFKKADKNVVLKLPLVIQYDGKKAINRFYTSGEIYRTIKKQKVKQWKNFIY